ncbi:hypothetical protein BIKONL_002865 [Pseudomonas putida]
MRCFASFSSWVILFQPCTYAPRHARLGLPLALRNKVNQATDQAFYDRADAHIELANQQIEKFEDLGKVSASLTFGAARFSAWMSARSFKSGAELGAAREEILKYFCDQYRMMLEDNLDEHIEHFDRYMLGKND